MDSYDTILAPAAAELTEKRSRFLCALRPVSTEEQAAALVAEKRARYHDARHHCSAWILRTGNIARCSDDGEPQGSAGQPMLEVLRREKLTDIAAVVTRYFGGTLLGVGGLTRAYSRSVKLALEAADRARMCRCCLFSLELPYALYDRADLLLQSSGATILSTDFAAGVTVRGRLPADKLPALRETLAEQTGGALSLLPLGEEFAPAIK